MTDKPNLALVIIDAFRFDLTSSKTEREILTPTISKLIDSGGRLKVTANAATTQFVLPSLLSQSYPLDYGGYDSGIRNRPKSFVECLGEAGYKTILATACNQYGMAHDFDRGFDHRRGLYSASGQIRRLIHRKLSYEIKLYEDGLQSKEDLESVFRSELGALLEKLGQYNEKESKLGGFWRRANGHNRKIAEGCKKELALLNRDPGAVVERVKKFGPRFYWAALGREDVRPLERNAVRALEFLFWKCDALVERIGLNIPKYAAWQFPVEEVFRGIGRVAKETGTPWYAHIHLMDVHSYFFFRGVIDSLRKARFLPRVLKVRRLSERKRPILHDLCLAQCDYALGKFLSEIQGPKNGRETIVAVIGDHGKFIPQVDDREQADVPHRFYREHLDTVLVTSKPAIDDAEAGGLPLLDSMSVSATLLDLCGVDGHSSFKGVSARKGGRPFVLSENAGRGSADLVRKDLYFAVTTQSHKLIIQLQGLNLVPLKLFNLQDDPTEMHDVKDLLENKPVIEELCAKIETERAELLDLRKSAMDASAS